MNVDHVVAQTARVGKDLLAHGAHGGRGVVAAFTRAAFTRRKSRGLLHDHLDDGAVAFPLVALDVGGAVSGAQVIDVALLVVESIAVFGAGELFRRFDSHDDDAILDGRVRPRGRARPPTLQ